jgi:ergothioneine biosynthesis protein EgtB
MASIELDDRLAHSRATETPDVPQALAQAYTLARAATVALCAPLATEDYVVQSMPDASPAKWHLAHTTWFFEEMVLKEATPGYRFHDERFRYLFNSYYNIVGPMHSRPRRGLITRPTVKEVLAYRACIDERMQELLSHPRSTAHEAAIALGLHHEQQHQELILTDLKHLFSSNPLQPAYQTQRVETPLAAPALSYRAFPGGLVDIGHAGAGFCFDNELPRHRVHLPAFKLANRLITNGEFLEFVKDGGYTRPECWLSDGWTTVRRQGWRRPMYWGRSLDEEFTLGGVRELDPAAPLCHVSYYEAEAFARWAGKRVPTELEWEHAATLALAAGRIEGHFADSGALHPRTARAVTGAPGELLQIFGDVWEWTQSAYSPYPGYRTAAGALGEYNGKFMVNQIVLRGGSCATPRGHIRASYRNFFTPATRWQFSGVRLACD